jgi:hypothetical protein
MPSRKGNTRNGSTQQPQTIDKKGQDKRTHSAVSDQSDENDGPVKETRPKSKRRGVADEAEEVEDNGRDTAEEVQANNLIEEIVSPL